MRKFTRWKAPVGAVLLSAVAVAVGSVGVAGAQVQGPEPWSGHGYGQCEPVTHAAYYDPRRDGQTVYNQDRPNGDNVYYVDTNPLSDFHADGSYPPRTAPNHDCDGTPALRISAYVAITLQGELWLDDKHTGYPACSDLSTRNPGCSQTRTGANGGVYVARGDGSSGTGTKAGVANPFSED